MELLEIEIKISTKNVEEAFKELDRLQQMQRTLPCIDIPKDLKKRIRNFHKYIKSECRFVKKSNKELNKISQAIKKGK